MLNGIFFRGVLLNVWWVRCFERYNLVCRYLFGGWSIVVAV